MTSPHGLVENTPYPVKCSFALAEQDLYLSGQAGGSGGGGGSRMGVRMEGLPICSSAAATASGKTAGDGGALSHVAVSNYCIFVSCSCSRVETGRRDQPCATLLWLPSVVVSSSPAPMSVRKRRLATLWLRRRRLSDLGPRGGKTTVRRPQGRRRGCRLARGHDGDLGTSSRCLNTKPRRRRAD